MNKMRLSTETPALGLKVFLKLLRAGIWLAMLSAVLCLLLLPFVVDEVALGPRFRWAVFGSVAVAICLSFLLIVSFRPALSVRCQRIWDAE